MISPIDPGQLLLRLGHQAAHAGQLADLLTGASRAGHGHQVDRVEPVLVAGHDHRTSRPTPRLVVWVQVSMILL